MLNLKQNVEKMKDENRKKEEQLEDAKEKLRQKLEYTEKYHVITKEFNDWFNPANQTPVLNEPIKEDVESIKEQLDKIEVCMTCSYSCLAVFPLKFFTTTLVRFAEKCISFLYPENERIPL